MQIWVATFIVEYWVRSDKHGSNYIGESYHKIHDSASDLTNDSEIKDYVALSELSVTLYTFLTANMNRKSQSRQLRLLYFQKVFYRSCLSNHIHRLLISVGALKWVLALVVLFCCWSVVAKESISGLFVYFVNFWKRWTFFLSPLSQKRLAGQVPSTALLQAWNEYFQIIKSFDINIAVRGVL